MSHGGTERTEGYQSKAMEVTKTPSVHRATELVCTLFQQLYAQSIYPKSYQESVGYTSVALCAVSTSVTLHYLRSLRDSVCLLYMTFSLSLHLSEEPKKISNVSKIVLFTYDNSFIQVYCKALTLLPKLLQKLEFHPIVFTSNPYNTPLIDDFIVRK